MIFNFNFWKFIQNYSFSYFYFKLISCNFYLDSKGKETEKEEESKSKLKQSTHNKISSLNQSNQSKQLSNPNQVQLNLMKVNHNARKSDYIINQVKKPKQVERFQSQSSVPQTTFPISRTSTNYNPVISQQTSRKGESHEDIDGIFKNQIIYSIITIEQDNVYF